MRWLPVGLLNLAVVCLQSAIAPHLAVRGIRPDWLIVLVVFWGLYARRWRGVFAACLLGALADLMTIERFGVQMCIYTLAAILITSVRLQVFRYRWTAQFALTLIAGFLVQSLCIFYVFWTFGRLGRSLTDWFAAAAFTSLYSAAWAPLVHSLLLRRADWFGLSRPKTQYAG